MGFKKKLKKELPIKRQHLILYLNSLNIFNITSQDRLLHLGERLPQRNQTLVVHLLYFFFHFFIHFFSLNIPKAKFEYQMAYQKTRQNG